MSGKLPPRGLEQGTLDPHPSSVEAAHHRPGEKEDIAVRKSPWRTNKSVRPNWVCSFFSPRRRIVEPHGVRKKWYSI